MSLQGRVNPDNITLGLGVLELGQYDSNGNFTAYNDIGAIKATGTVTWGRNILTFMTGRPMKPIKRQATEESFTVQFTLAEVSVANIKFSLSAGTRSDSVVPTFLDGTSIAPTGDIFSSSVHVVGQSTKFDFGGDCDVAYFGLRFTHLKSCGDGKRQILEVYKASPIGNLALPFNETDWNQFQIEWTALADTTKATGKQFCQFIDEL